LTTPQKYQTNAQRQLVILPCATAFPRWCTWRWERINWWSPISSSTHQLTILSFVA